MASDLVGGKWPLSNVWLAAHGLANNVQSNVPARSNLEYLGFSTLTDGALAGSGVACAVPVPCDPGFVITYVSIVVGATAASTPTHGAVGIYSGIATPALLANSADTTTTAIPASAVFAYTLSSAYLVKPADVPNGFLYVSVTGTGTAIQTAAAISVPTAVGYQWFTSSTTPKGNSPVGWSVTHGSALNGTMPATIATPAAKAVAPIVFIS